MSVGHAVAIAVLLWIAPQLCTASATTVSPSTLWPEPVSVTRLYGTCSCALTASVSPSSFTMKLIGQQSALLTQAAERHVALAFAWDKKSLRDKIARRLSRKPSEPERKPEPPTYEDPADGDEAVCSYSVPYYNKYLGLCADDPTMYPCPTLPTLAAAMAHCDTLPACGGITHPPNRTDYEVRVGPMLEPSTIGEVSWLKTCPSGVVGNLGSIQVNVTGTDTAEYPYDGMDESYTLMIPQGAPGQTISGTITAKSVWGAMRGMQTFTQLVQYNFSSQAYTVQPVAIVDYPRFPFRGVMIDTSRRFHTVETILSILDGMEWSKLNVLHFHVTDDQSWPIVLPSLPLLAELGAWTASNHIYEPSDIATIVNYAAARGIRVIPEIDTPAHDSIIAIAYPQVITNGLLDPTNNETWVLLGKMISDVRSMFPDKSFFIGGDETNTGAWNTPAINLWMKQHNISSLTNLANYYYARLIGMLNDAGFTEAIAWSPGVGDLPGAANMTHSNWQGYEFTGPQTPGAFAAWQQMAQSITMAGHKMILAGPWYVMMAYQRWTPEVNTLWTDLYHVDPQNFTGTAAQKELVVGGECVVWDDNTAFDSGSIVVGIFPDCSAVAEQLWTPQVLTNGTAYATSRPRLIDHRCRMIGRGLDAAVPIMFNPLQQQIGFCPIEWASIPPTEYLEMRSLLDKMLKEEEAREREL